MPVKFIGGWWYVKFTHRGKRWNINTMMRGDHREREAQEYENRLRSALREKDANEANQHRSPGRAQ